MGQAHSEEVRSKEDIAAELAEKFARKCFEPLELYCFKDNFRSLADHEQHIRYLKEDVIAKFLELPDVLNVSPVVFQMLSYIGAFPFLEDAPAVLGFEQMIVCVAILTDRYTKSLAKGAATRRKLLFKSMAVYDRKLSEIEKRPASPTVEAGEDDAMAGRSHAPGFAVDEAGDDDDDEGVEDADDDELVLAALDSLDLNDSFKTGDLHAASTHGAMIPADNFRRLIMLLLLIAPLSPPGNILDGLRDTANSILSSLINVERTPGITFAQFQRILPANLPFLFQGFNALFEHFLFSRNLDFTKKHKWTKSGSDIDTTASPPPSPPAIRRVRTSSSSLPPLLPDKGQHILNPNIVSQLSFFIPGNELFRRLRLLYSGADAGFSMGSFETKVFNWRAPTLLLVSGTRLTESSDSHHHAQGAEGSFMDSLPPRRFPDGSPAGRSEDRVVFGVLVKQPWRAAHRECFGDSDTLLFQLSPVHDVFRASVVNQNYVSFAKTPAAFPGITVGCPSPKAATQSRHPTIRTLGPVSLVIDSSFEFGVFTHDYTSRGGAFATSSARRYDFQDRFQVEDIEVWGCGGDEEAKGQRERWEWEHREAEARRRINLGTGDREADRALLEMAGLVGNNRSGGSMN
ncbi:restriction of telomere capping 5 [Apiospora hydei]|uniref:Restriction of telomere capping protein 5 n=1 Tax=Apiospora hydei TaxID=1337664 RepID=A0ABR1VZW7_9PEZI